MRIVLQRVAHARVEVDKRVVGEIKQGVLIFLGVAIGDTQAEVEWGVNKIVELRVFSDQDGKFNLSLEDINGAALVVSQFTLLGDMSKGRRPSFIEAAPPAHAIPIYESFVSSLRNRGITVATGVFGAKMEVHLLNEGPVTLVLERTAAPKSS